MSDPFKPSAQNNFGFGNQDNNYGFGNQDNNYGFGNQDNNYGFGNQDNGDLYRSQGTNTNDIGQGESDQYDNDQNPDDYENQNDDDYAKQKVNLRKMGIVEYQPDNDPETHATPEAHGLSQEMLNNGIEITKQTLPANDYKVEPTVAVLVDKGYTEEQAYYVIQKGILEMQRDTEGGDGSGRGAHLTIGIICLLAGILLTAFSVGNAIWYGAIIVGIIEIIRGLLGSSK